MSGQGRNTPVSVKKIRNMKSMLTRLTGSALMFLCFAFAPVPVKKTIVIDAGHGGDDHGATHDKITEKQLVQAIASKIKALDVSSELEIILLREDDISMTLNERVEKINSLNPDLLISLHVNYSQDRSDNGVSAYVSQKSVHYATSLEKAHHVVKAFTGSELAAKEVKDVNAYVLSHSKCPSILLELGYLTNEKDRRYISSEAGQQEIAQKIISGLNK